MKPRGDQAISDDRRVVAELLIRRRAPWRFAGDMTGSQTAVASGLVLEGSFFAAVPSAASQPLALPVQNIANRLTASGAAEARGIAD
jgi:hypothetical protein